MRHPWPDRSLGGVTRWRSANADVASAFTLVELLVVLGVIAILVGMLMPALGNARRQANLVRCSGNLSEIYRATLMYSNDNDDHLPDAVTTGQYTYRMRPGMTSLGDSSAEPELYGLAAVLHGLRPSDRGSVATALHQKPRYLEARSDVWVCPAQSDLFKSYGNTYAFSVSTAIASWTSQKRSGLTASRTLWVWDVYANLPGLSGFRGPFSGYTLATAKRQYPHTMKNRKFGATNVLYLDGHVERHQIASN